MSELGIVLSTPNPYQQNYKNLVRKAKVTKWEDRFRTLVRGLGAPPWREQYRFHSTRMWRFDFAWPERKIAFEIEGGIWRPGGGAHSHPENIERDVEKNNAAVLLGWSVIRITGKMLNVRTLYSGDAAQLVTAAFKLDPSRLSGIV